MVKRLFRDRVDAGRQLSVACARYRDSSPIVLGVPRGGVPVAFEVARALEATLDLCVMRKIGTSVVQEDGVGAIAEGGALYIDAFAVESAGFSGERLEALIAAERLALDERVTRFRGGLSALLDVRDRLVIVVVDGVATGATARAALHTLRIRGARRLVLAVPAARALSLVELASVADEIVCPFPDEEFLAISLCYEDFAPTTDDLVRDLLARSRAGAGGVS